MAADVLVAAQVPVLVAHDEDRLCSRRGGQVAARSGQRRHVPGQLPGPFEDQLLFCVQQGRIRVQAGLESRAGGRGRGDRGVHILNPDFVIS